MYISLYYLILLTFKLHALSHIATYLVTPLNLKPCCKNLGEELFYSMLRYSSLELNNTEQQLEFPQDTQGSHLHDPKCSQYWIFDIYVSHENEKINSILWPYDSTE